MCGIAGKLNLTSNPPVESAIIHAMLAAIHHRGPDENGVYINDEIGLGSARLSIIDLASGKQPISNEDGSVWVVFNGEIYNYLELRKELQAAGHIFRTQSDTEVLVHLYEENQSDWLLHLNGQFAIALWDARQHRLILARDRLGVRPIYYTLQNNRFIFASEAKALFAHPGITPQLDPISLAQVFTFWTTLSGRSAFQNIQSVPPAHYLSIQDGTLTFHRYWELDFNASTTPPKSVDDAAEILHTLLADAIRMRLRSDVPVGAYLSGGLDSSCITALTSQQVRDHLKTFSLSFSDPAFDESQHQTETNEYLNVQRSTIYCTANEIAAHFPEAVYAAEMPLLRTAPAPMLMLSRFAHLHGYKVVLTGEGADELLGGYDIFKEGKIRRFWARNPNSKMRPALLRRLYPYLGGLSANNEAYLKMFFGKGLVDTDDPFYSHQLRWNNTARCKRFFSADVQAQLRGYDPLADLRERLPQSFNTWHPFAQAQYLEITIFLSEYLLSSQGDRMGMANSVEGRYPFLDPRVVDFSLSLPADFKMRGLREKYILKHAMQGILPPATIKRVKQPYRAPIRSVFFGTDVPHYVKDSLSSHALQTNGWFDPQAVTRLVSKCQHEGPVSETEEMAAAGILSVQLLSQMWRS